MAVDSEGVRWHALEVEEAVSRLGTSMNAGLSDGEASSRLLRYGHNRMREEKRTHPLMLFLNQFRDFMIYVLLGAAVISGAALREYFDAAVIMFVVLANAVLGFIQEYRAGRALESLKKLSAPTARVIRGNVERVIPSSDLVPGDLILLETGDRIPADARLLEAHSMRTDEASLTGESLAVEKTTQPLQPADIPLGDRRNIVYAGTHIVHGRGSALVAETGRHTELGRIAEMLGEAEEERTPLQRDLGRTGRNIALLCIGICAVVFAMGMLRRLEWSEMFLFSVSLAVAAIPEGLPAIVTIALALGVKRMAGRKALLRRLTAVETLGCAEVICTDKTGTLTRNEMEVREIKLPMETTLYPESMTGSNTEWEEAVSPMLATAVLCNDARIQEGRILGEGTEIALIQMARNLDFSFSAAVEAHPRVEEIPFESERKMMSTINDNRSAGGYFPFLDSSLVILSKGAPEILLERCTHYRSGEGVRVLGDTDRDDLAHLAEEMANRALRTLAFACRPLQGFPEYRSLESLENELVFLGLVGMMDPPRDEVFGALELCRKANIEVVMITGDHAATAKAIAKELSILTPGKEMVNGEELARMDDEELSERVENIAVYARVSPTDKVKIVRAWKAKGKTVAMTGDGVNDAPALKNADIGVAMGITGTDVSKEASDMILADDNFATIVGAVEEGRVIYDNLKKFISFLLSGNLSEVTTIFVGMLVTSATPLRAVQILWMNLVTDSLTAMALGVDTPAPDIMARPPRDPSEGILSMRNQVMILWQGLLLSLGSLPAFFIAYYALYPNSIGKVQTVTFTTLVLAELMHSFNLRSERLSFVELPFFGNKALLLALAACLALHMAVIFVPPLMGLLGTEFLDAAGWGLILVCSIIPVIAIDRVKVILRSRSSG